MIDKKNNSLIMNKFIDDLTHSVFFNEKKLLSAGSLSGIISGAVPFFLLSAFKFFQENKKSLVFITPDDLSAQRIYEEVLFLYQNSNQFVKKNNDDILYFPSWGIMPFTYSVPDSRKEAERAKTLSAILSQIKSRLIVVSLDSLIQKIPQKETFEEKSLRFKVHSDYKVTELAGVFHSLGYEKTEIVQNYGQFSIKGNIIDIFSPLYFHPVRFDFFGDHLERIVQFDPDTQKSYKTLNEVQIFQRHDLNISGEDLDKLNEKTKKLSDKNFEPPPFMENPELEKGGQWDLFPLIYNTESFLEYLSKDSHFFLHDEEKIGERLLKIEEEIVFLRNRNEKKIMLDKNLLFLSEDEFKNLTSSAIRLTSVPRTLEEERLNISYAPVYKGKISGFIEDLQKRQKNKTIYVSAKTQIQIDRLNHIFSGYEDKIEPPVIIMTPLDTGFESDKVLFITEKDLFGKSSRIGKIQKSATEVIKSFTDLKNGDYVVHVNYGIGQFKGLKRMTVAGFNRDFIEVEYAESNKLYIPIEQLHLVHKYIGSSDHPSLDHLGKKSAWSKTKSKAKESIEKLAQELLELYARREKAVGIQFPADSRFQEEFEASFPFEETEHQLMAINEVKRDMESEKPMDRLVCGDVGFGKTEVAIRAAFKCVMAGRQVSILCPTTILAFQHYNTFRKRFEGYPVNIELISRFRSASEISKIQQRVKEGKVDIVIGTHALLGKQMIWKNLGLLVVDEEQRFGVKQKEYIKNLKANIDCLTMTATPIPRTLQMSLIGIRDLSIIETPPRNRLKVETYVLEENDEVLYNAIKKEIERHGQVLILHNKVQTIEMRATTIKNIAPMADITIMHGQMSEDEIEERMLDFYNKKHNVLVSTTIIESGVDLPDANTLIVLNAQNFGLSQLYQIKGRVGRSDRQAFAYFFYPAGLTFNEKSEKRLNTLMEYDGLGDGFKIAMKDLEIRGAGNLLGKEQSGDIMAIGFELYVNMLHEKLSELNNEPIKEEFECNLQIPLDYFIPDDYIHDIRQKMEFYKRLGSLQLIEEIDDLKNELSDRFGEPPESVTAMLIQEKLRLIGKELRFERVIFNNGVLSLFASPHMNEALAKIVALIQKDKRFTLDPNDPRRLNYQTSTKNVVEVIREASNVLSYLV